MKTPEPQITPQRERKPTEIRDKPTEMKEVEGMTPIILTEGPRASNDPSDEGKSHVKHGHRTLEP